MPPKQRNYRDENKRRKILLAWRDENGDWCPGYPWCDAPNIPHRTPDLTVDHIRPQALGGDSHPDNLRIMCRVGNSRRHAGRPPTRRTLPPSRDW